MLGRYVARRAFKADVVARKETEVRPLSPPNAAMSSKTKLLRTGLVSPPPPTPPPHPLTLHQWMKLAFAAMVLVRKARVITKTRWVMRRRSHAQNHSAFSSFAQVLARRQKGHGSAAGVQAASGAAAREPSSVLAEGKPLN
jgi:hypothetical protein